MRFIQLLQSSSAQLYKLECLFRFYEAHFPCMYMSIEQMANLLQTNQSDLIAEEAKIKKQIIVLGCFACGPDNRPLSEKRGVVED